MRSVAFLAEKCQADANADDHRRPGRIASRYPSYEAGADGSSQARITQSSTICSMSVFVWARFNQL